MRLRMYFNIADEIVAPPRGGDQKGQIYKYEKYYRDEAVFIRKPCTQYPGRATLG